MTVATYVSDLVDIFLWENDDDVVDYGGGGQASSVGIEYTVEGTFAVAKPISASERGFLHDDVDDFTIGTNDHIFSWCLCSIPGLMATRDNRGLVMCIGDDDSNFVKFHLQGGDTLPFGGIQPYAVRFDNTTLANRRTLEGTPGTTPSWIGVGSNITAVARFDNTAIDASRIGTGYDILGGTSADPEADFAGISADDASTAEGIFVTTDGGFRLQGKLRLGDGSDPCEFLDSNTSILLVDSIHSLTNFTEILIEHADSIVTLSNVGFFALGTNNPGRLEVLTGTATLTFSSVSFIDFGVTVLGSGSTLDNCTWVGAGIITCNGGSLNGGSVSGFEGTANTSPVIWDDTDPDGSLDDMTFTQGTAATHAIEFGVDIPSEITLRGIDFNGYSSSDNNDGSVFHFLDTGGTITVNLIDCTAPVSGFTVRDEGAIIDIVIAPVQTKLTIETAAGDLIENARVFIETADDGGGTGFPFEAGIATLVQVAGTATLTSDDPHDLATNDYIVVRASTSQHYNRTVQITVTGPSELEYPVDSAAAATALGTPVFSYMPLSGLTDVLGEISSSKSWPAAQALKGWARKSTASPLFQQTAISITDASGGTDLLVALQSDE